MLQHIYKDMLSVMRYLPAGIAIGIPVAGVLYFLCRKKKQKTTFGELLPMVCFGVYFGVIAVITFFSRELGSRADKDIDLTLFSTWGINDRNNAYVIENVLLFVPYTFLYCCAYKDRRNFVSCFLLGAVTSLCIECMQLATARGVFQIDDIITNLLGAILGWLLYKIFAQLLK